MSKTCRSVIVCCSMLFAQLIAVAQVERGDLETSFSATVSWSESTTKLEGYPDVDDDSRGFYLNARCGYFLTNRIDLGGILGMSYSRFDDGKSYGWSLGPAANYHFRPKQSVVPFIGGGAGAFYQKSEIESFGFSSEAEAHGWFAEARGGADFFLNRNVALKLQLVYTRRQEDADRVSISVFPPFQSETTYQRESQQARLWFGLGVFLDTRK